MYYSETQISGMLDVATQTMRSVEREGWLSRFARKPLRYFQNKVLQSSLQATYAEWLSGTWTVETVAQVPNSLSLDQLDDLMITFGVSSSKRPTYFISTGRSSLFPKVSEWSWLGLKDSGISIQSVAWSNAFRMRWVDRKSFTLIFTKHAGLYQGNYRLTFNKLSAK